jgi:hypothetical protein
LLLVLVGIRLRVSLLQKIRSWWRHGDVDQLDPSGRAEQEKIRAQGSTFKAASGEAAAFGVDPRPKDDRPKWRARREPGRALRSF